MSRPDFEGAKYVISPPIRDKWNQDVLLRKLKNMELHTFGSDHCSFNLCGQKELGKHDFSKIPNGAPTIEDRLAILYHVGVNGGVISANQFVALVRPIPRGSSDYFRARVRSRSAAMPTLSCGIRKQSARSRPRPII